MTENERKLYWRFHSMHFNLGGTRSSGSNMNDFAGGTVSVAFSCNCDRASGSGSMQTTNERNHYIVIFCLLRDEAGRRESSVCPLISLKNIILRIPHCHSMHLFIIILLIIRLAMGYSNCRRLMIPLTSRESESKISDHSRQKKI
jgi:hypothetical protein